MRHSLVLTLLACGALFGKVGENACYAGGEGVIVQALGDRLVIGAGDDSPGGQQLGQRVVGDVLPPVGVDDNPSFFSFSPPPVGFDALPVGGLVQWDFLPITIDGVTSNLFHWDATGSIDFAPAAGEKLSLFDATASIPKTVDGVAAATPGDNLGVIFETSGVGQDVFGLHAHNFWALQGEGGDPLILGSGDDPAPGVYLTAMRLRLDGYIPSDPFFVALGTFGTPTSALDNDALPWIEANIDDLILRGDYNFDGLVDSVDYDLWRDQLGAAAPQPVNVGEADGNRDGVVNTVDYLVWRDNLTTASIAAESLAVPEPSGAAIALGVAVSLAIRRRG